MRKNPFTALRTGFESKWFFHRSTVANSNRITKTICSNQVQSCRPSGVLCAWISSILHTKKRIGWLKFVFVVYIMQTNHIFQFVCRFEIDGRQILWVEKVNKANTSTQLHPRCKENAQDFRTNRTKMALLIGQFW